jgi:UDP-N-acetylmuramoyl-L-alanyl-D-glutamate--2,6-diaminopimelate ligase
MSRYPVASISVRELVNAAGVTASIVNEEALVGGLTQDSRSVEAGDMYCCVRGQSFDGHSFISQAIAAGATALLVDSPVAGVPDSVAVITVGNVRSVLGAIASAAFGFPARALTMVGVTGTNGKTSTAAMVSSILRAAGKRVEVVGTLSGARTTPEAIDLQAFLSGVASSGTTHVVMEVSSHALDQSRVSGMTFDVSVFTNLSRDHLDYHKTDEAYFAAKAKLFTPELSKRGVMNSDDPRGRLLLDVAAIPMVAFALSDATNATVRVDSVSFNWRGLNISLPMGGAFTLINAIAALTACAELGIEDEYLIDGCAQLTQVPGRFESVANTHGIGIVVDYAHTPDGLREVISSARALCRGRLIVVFGCGGDRDQGKRPLMGAAAQEADIVFVTSDNPRSEDPQSIIDAILVGLTGSTIDIHVVVDRGQAIASAILEARRDDIVVIAGKGHESTQEVAGVHHPFNDVDVAKSALSQKKGSEL